MFFRRIVYLLVLLSALLAQLFDVGYLVHYLFILILVLPLAGLALSLPAMLGCRPKLLTRNSQVQRGSRVSWFLTLDNRFPLPLARVSCCFQVREFMSGETRSFRKSETEVFPGLVLPLQLATRHCGRLECRVQRIWMCDCLGLFALPVKPPAPTSVLVGPVPVQTDTVAIPEQKGAVLPAPKGRSRVGEDYDLRDYHPGDSVRSIHWKLSAKRDQLIVRELLAARRPLPVLIFDHLGPPEELDGIIDRVAGLSLFFQRRGQPHEIRWAHPVNGHAHRFVIEDAPTWQQCLTAILSDPAPDQGHSLLEQPVRPVGEDPIFPIRIRREEDCHGNP